MITVFCLFLIQIGNCFQPQIHQKKQYGMFRFQSDRNDSFCKIKCSKTIIQSTAVIYHPYGRLRTVRSGFEYSPDDIFGKFIYHFNTTYDTIFGTSNNHNPITIVPVPHVYEMNDKRYEKKWLDYMNDFPLSYFNHVVTLDSGGSEAILRYLESYQLSHVTLVDAFDIYTAGERHGRDFRFSRILQNIDSIKFIATTEIAEKSIRKFHEELKSKIPLQDMKNADSTKINVHVKISSIVDESITLALR